MVLIGLIYHTTIETCWKRVEGGWYEQWKIEMCRFPLDMSFVMHCRVAYTIGRDCVDGQPRTNVFIFVSP